LFACGRFSGGLFRKNRWGDFCHDGGDFVCVAGIFRGLFRKNRRGDFFHHWGDSAGEIYFWDIISYILIFSQKHRRWGDFCHHGGDFVCTEGRFFLGGRLFSAKIRGEIFPPPGRSCSLAGDFPGGFFAKIDGDIFAMMEEILSALQGFLGGSSAKIGGEIFSTTGEILLGRFISGILFHTF
jgi:hypothetical protein